MVWMIHGLKPSSGKRFFSSPKCPDCCWVPLSLLFSGYQCSLLRIKQLGPEIEHPCPSSTEVKNTCSCTSASSYAFMA